jgi:hypothetical protein
VPAWHSAAVLEFLLGWTGIQADIPARRNGSQTARGTAFPGFLCDELRRFGFAEGQNLNVDGYFSMRDEDAPKVAMALVANHVDAIVTGGYPRTRAAQDATQTIPILTAARRFGICPGGAMSCPCTENCLTSGRVPVEHTANTKGRSDPKGARPKMGQPSAAWGTLAS